MVKPSAILLISLAEKNRDMLLTFNSFLIILVKQSNNGHRRTICRSIKVDKMWSELC